MSTVIAVANQKGGCGKTTSAVNLAAALARDSRVLLVDLDAQANATQWLTGQYGPDGRVTQDVLLRRADLADCVIAARPRIGVVPGNLDLASLDIELMAQINRERRLATALEPVADEYDYVLLDCPPALGLCTLNAFTACQVAVIPIDCRGEALLAVPKLLQHLAAVEREYGHTIACYALPTFYERTNLAKEMLGVIQETFDAMTLPAVHKNTKIAEAFVLRRTIFEHDSSASGAVDYLRISKELRSDLEATSRAVSRSPRRSTRN